MSHARQGRLRVIAGSARGRKLIAPPGDLVRPTKDMVREAMFSALDARGALVGSSVLDLFAGTGALGIEALSRGAEGAVFVENDRSALNAIASNIATVGLDDRARVIPADVHRLLHAPPPPAAPFDLVLIDPPYQSADEDVTALLERLGHPGWLASDAIVSVERPARHPVALPTGWQTGWERGFGDTLLSFCWR